MMTKRDVAVKQLCNKRARSSLQWVPREPGAADEDPALMTFSEDEMDESMFDLGYDPFLAKTGDEVQDPFVTRSGAEEQEAADTGGSSSSGAVATTAGESTCTTSTLTEVQREKIAANKKLALEKKEANKLANRAKRKTALEKKLAREGVGALNEAQLGVLRGVPKAAVAKVEVPADSSKRSSEVLNLCEAVEKKASKRARPTSVAKDEEADHWWSLSEGERAQKLTRCLVDRKVTRSQVRLTAGSGEPVVEAEASDPVTAHRPARPVWGSSWRR